MSLGRVCANTTYSMRLQRPDRHVQKFFGADVIHRRGQFYTLKEAQDYAETLANFGDDGIMGAK